MANEKVQVSATLENAQVENGNVAVEATSVEPAEAAAAAQPAAALTIDEIIKRVLADGHSRKVVVDVTDVETAVEASKNGNDYTNAWITTKQGIIANQQMPDGTRRLGLLGRFQTPFGQLSLVMRKHPFFGRYTRYIEDAASVGFAGLYLAGCKLTVLAQFVAAGEKARNPFTRKDNEYDVQTYDRYIYHIVGIEQPQDAVTLANYAELNKQIVADAREALRAKREAAAAAKTMMTNIMAGADMPF